MVLSIKHPTETNLTSQEISALEELENDTSITIKSIEKQGAKVIQNTIAHENKCHYTFRKKCVTEFRV